MPYYDKPKPYFGQEKLQLHYMDTDSFVLSVSTKDIINNLKNLEDLFDFSNLDENHDLFTKKIKKLIGFFSKLKVLKYLDWQLYLPKK